MNTIPTKLTQSKQRKFCNDSWFDFEKGPELLKYENSLAWPVDRPKLLKDVIERIKNNS